MATIANLNVILNLEDNAFQRGLQNSRDKLDSWGSSLRNIGTKMTAGVTAPLVLAGGAMVNWASDLDESINKVNVLFDGAAGTVLDFSETTATGLGMSQQASLDFSAAFAGMLKPVAANSDELANMSTEMTQLVGDFASFNNLAPEEAFTVLSSAMAGETEAIRKYGVDVSAAAVEQKAMEMGLAATSGELTEQDKLLARYALIMEQTTDAQGDFARTQDSTSNKMKTFRARVQDLGASFGKLLLPYVNKVLDVFSDLMDWLGKLDGGTRKWVVGIAALAAAIGPVLLVLGMLLPGLSALLGLFGAIISPISLVVAALVALAAVFRDDIIDAVQTAVEWFTDFVTSSQNVQDMVGNLVDAFNAFKSGDFGEAFAAVGRAAGNLWGAIQEAVAQIDWGSIGQSLLDGLASLASFVAGFVLNLGSIAVSVAGWLWNQVVDLWDGLVSWAVGLVPAGEPVNLGTVLVAVAKWAAGLIPDIWAWLQGIVVGGTFGDGTGGATASAVGGVSLANVLVNIASWSKGVIVDIYEAIKGWIEGQLTGRDWSSIGTTVGNAIRNAVRDGIQNAADLFAVLFSWISDQIRNVDWNSVGSTFAELLVAGIKGIVGLVGLAGWLLGQILLAIVEVDWSSVGSAFKTFLSSALTAIVDFLTGFATTIYDEIYGELSVVNWAGLGSSVKTWAADIWQGITDALQPIIDAAVVSINFLIEQLNKIPGVDIPKIGGIEDIGTDADAAADKVLNLQSVLQNMMTGGILGLTSAGRGALGQPTTGAPGTPVTPYTPYANPYNPTEGGAGGMVEFMPFEQLSSALDGAAKSAASLAANMVPANTQLASLSGRTTDVTTFGNVATEKFTSTGNSAKSNLQPIGPLAAQMAAQLVGTAVPAFTQMNSVAQSTLSAMRGIVQSTFAAIASIVTSSTTQAASVARSQFTAMASSVTSQVNSMASQVQGRFSAMQGATSASLNAMRGAAQSAASQLASALSSGAAQAASAVQSQIGRIPGIVASVGGSAAATAYSVGANISNSFANGMRSALGAIQSAAAQMVSAADQAIRAKARIASPSRVFAGLGENIGEGFEHGIRSTIPDAARAAGDLVSVPGVPHLGGDGARENGQVIQIITLEPGKWKEFLANAEAGGSFARNFGGELAMMGGQG